MSAAQYRLYDASGRTSEQGSADVSTAAGALVIAPAGSLLRVPFGQITALTEPEPFVVLVEFGDGGAVELSRLGVIRTQLLAEIRDGLAQAAGGVGEASVFGDLRVYDDALLAGTERIGFAFVDDVQVRDYVITIQVRGRDPLVLTKLGRRTTELADLLSERLREARGRTAAFIGSLLPDLDPIAARSVAALLRDGVAAGARELDAIRPGLTEDLVRLVTQPGKLERILGLTGSGEFAIGFKQVASVRRPATGAVPWHDHAAQPHIGEHDSQPGPFGPGLTGVLTASLVEDGNPYWALRALGRGGSQERAMAVRPDLALERGRVTPASEDLGALPAAMLAFALYGGDGRVSYEVLNGPGAARREYESADLAAVNRALVFPLRS